MPAQARKVLVVDPEQWKTSSFGVVGNSGDQGEILWHGGVLANDDKIYGIPFDANAILVIEAGWTRTRRVVSGNRFF